MDLYEIRVLDDDGATALIFAAIHLNNNTAIRSAEKIAHGRRFEVWKGMDCVHGSPGAMVIALASKNLTNNL